MTTEETTSASSVLEILDINKTYSTDNYPYGFKKTRAFYNVEFDSKKGFRVIFQTIDPKTKRMNNPKKGTYGAFSFLTRDTENGYLKVEEKTLYGGAYDKYNSFIEFILENQKHLNLTAEMIKFFAYVIYKGCKDNLYYSSGDMKEYLKILTPIFKLLIEITKSGNYEDFQLIYFPVTQLKAIKENANEDNSFKFKVETFEIHNNALIPDKVEIYNTYNGKSTPITLKHDHVIEQAPIIVSSLEEAREILKADEAPAEAEEVKPKSKRINRQALFVDFLQNKLTLKREAQHETDYVSSREADQDFFIPDNKMKFYDSMVNGSVKAEENKPFHYSVSYAMFLYYDLRIEETPRPLTKAEELLLKIFLDCKKNMPSISDSTPRNAALYLAIKFFNNPLFFDIVDNYKKDHAVNNWFQYLEKDFSFFDNLLDSYFEELNLVDFEEQIKIFSFLYNNDRFFTNYRDDINYRKKAEEKNQLKTNILKFPIPEPTEKPEVKEEVKTAEPAAPTGAPKDLKNNITIKQGYGLQLDFFGGEKIVKIKHTSKIETQQLSMF